MNRKEFSAGLSAAGGVRRQRMLTELQEELAGLRRFRRRRRMVLAVCGAAILFALGAGGWYRLQAGVEQRAVTIAGGPGGSAGPSAHPVIPALARDQSVAGDGPLELELIDDSQLLDLLAEAGFPSGLAQIDGRAVVIPMHGSAPD